MKEEKLVVTIDKDGNVHGDVVAGPGGAGCLDLLDEVLGEVGNKVNEVKKDEFYQMHTGLNGVKQGRG